MDNTLQLAKPFGASGSGPSREALEAIGRSLGHPEARVIGFGF